MIWYDMIGSLYNFFSKIIPAIIICTQIFDIRKLGHFERLLNRSTSSTSNNYDYFSAKLFVPCQQEFANRHRTDFVPLSPRCSLFAGNPTWCPNRMVVGPEIDKLCQSENYFQIALLRNQSIHSTTKQTRFTSAQIFLCVSFAKKK